MYNQFNLPIIAPIGDPHLKNGYYIFDNKIYVNRDYIAEDILASNDFTKPNPTFWFHDEYFSHLNWQIEPLEDVYELYKLRALQLRDKYKYLILSLSGGIDSQVILETFLKNNIFIDEIQIVTWQKLLNKIDRTELINDPDCKTLLEYELNAAPWLKVVKDKSPNTKITVLDSSDFLVDDVLSGRFDSLSMHNNLGHYRGLYILNPRSFILLQSKEMDNTITRDSVGFVLGIEKPLVDTDGIGNNLYFSFSDAGLNFDKVLNNKICDPTFTVENFYWSVDAPKIVIKQAHMVKHALENDRSFFNTYMKHKAKFRHAFRRKGPEQVVGQVNHPWNSFEEHLAKIIYPRSTLNFLSGKPPLGGFEYPLLTKYHGEQFSQRIVAAKQEALDFRIKRYEKLGPAYTSKLVLSKKYEFGTLNPIWQKL